MRKKILSIYLAVAIGFLSVVASAVPAYASSSPEWSDYFELKYYDTVVNPHYEMKFKSDSAKEAYKKLSKEQKKEIDLTTFDVANNAQADSLGYGDSVLESTSLPDLIVGISSAVGIVRAGIPYSAGYVLTDEIKSYLVKISDAIFKSNRKFGGKGISRKASSAHPNNFGLGTLTLSKGFINDLRSRIAQFENYVIYPPAPSELNYYLNFVGIKEFNSSSAVETYNTSVVPYHYWVAYEKSNSGYNLVYFVSTPRGCLYYKDGFGRLVGLIGTSTTNKYSKSGYKLYKNNDDGSSYSFSYFSDYAYCKDLVGRIGIYQKVFNSYNDLYNYVNYLNGNKVSNYYISTEIVNNDYSTTVNKIYDYSSHDTYTTINNNITQAITDKGSGLTDEEYQKIVDEVMKKVQQEIDSKDDGGNTGGGTGGDSGNTGGGSSGGSGADSGENDTWLEKIYNRLGDVLGKIGTVTGVDTLVSLVQQIVDDIKTLKEGGTLSADLSDTNGLLKDIKKLLGTLIAVQAAGDVADLLTDTVGDKISDFVDNLKSGVSEVTDALQDVFPFSIPWDLMTILALFSAEPQAPVFDIPVNIPQLGVEHSIHVDLSDFESVSVICRAFLSLSFAVGLMYLTIRITGGKDDD